MRVVFFDFETGGVELHHPNIQLAAVAVDEHLKELAIFSERIIFNEEACDPQALAMNHYDRDLWKATALEPAVVFKRFAAFLRSFDDIEMVSQRTGRPYRVARLAGHNAATFDGPRLQAKFRSLNLFLPASYQILDTLQRALWYFHEHPSQAKPASYQLGDLADYFGIETPEAHDALADCRTTIKLFKALTGA